MFICISIPSRTSSSAANDVIDSAQRHTWQTRDTAHNSRRHWTVPTPISETAQTATNTQVVYSIVRTLKL